MTDDDDVMRALRAHDEDLDRCGPCIWVGAEPTYTDRMSEQPEWLFDALGDDKRKRADRILARLARSRIGAAVVRSVGRQYGGESLPRWSLGLYARRDGKPVWNGPPDPLLADFQLHHRRRETLAGALTGILNSAGLSGDNPGCSVAPSRCLSGRRRDPAELCRNGTAAGSPIGASQTCRGCGSCRFTGRRRQLPCLF